MPDVKPKPIVDAHNRQQTEYFERTFKKTMVPRETPYIARHISEIVAFGDLSRDQRILEVGCGMGRYTLPLAARGYRIEGLDLTPGLLEHLRAYDAGRFGITTHCFDLLARPDEMAGAFDVVLGMFMLHHVHLLDESIRALKGYVRPGGRLLFMEPNPRNPLYYLQIAITPGMTWQGERGIRNMTQERLRLAGERAGLGEFELRRFGLLPPFIANLRLGARLERAVERLPWIEPILAFQMVRMTVPS